MNILYDSKNLNYKTPFGALMRGENCTIFIKIPVHCNTKEVYLCLDNYYNELQKRFLMEYVKTEDDYQTYTINFALDTCGLYKYYFDIVATDTQFFLYKHGYHDTNIGIGEKWQLTCYPNKLKLSDEFRGNVYYQIFPDRFYKYGDCDLSYKLKPYSVHTNLSDIPAYLPDENSIVQNNDFYGGNLKGIAYMLPYIKELSVDVIYLNPIFFSYSNHRYDTADYKRVDLMLGTLEDFQDLCNKAHEMGIKIILDGVFSHTGSNSIYFDINNMFSDGAYHNRDSKYRSWYYFDDYNNYTSWWGINTLPNIKKDNPDFINYIIEDENSVIAYWLKNGADGFRLDVADELPAHFLQRLNARCKEIKPDSIVIGEVWEDASNKESYGNLRTYFTAHELDSVMNYPFKNAIIALINHHISLAEFANSIMTICENYPKKILDCTMNILSTHDTARILTALGDKEFPMDKNEQYNRRLSEPRLLKTIPKLKVAAFLLFILPGSPCIYYGDEIGMQGFSDPFNRMFFSWDKVDYNILNFFKKLAKIKSTSQALKIGDMKVRTHHNFIRISRNYGRTKLRAIINFGEKTSFSVDGKILVSSDYVSNARSFVLEKYGFILYEVNNT